MKPILQLSNASKSFSGTTILKDINLSVNEGDFVSIIGYSGTGKSTLVNLVAGLLQPNNGTAEFNGAPIMGPDPQRGIVFQNYSLLPWLTVMENVALAVDQIFPNLSKAERKAHAEHYVNMVKLTPAAGKYPKELSGGMRQRVSVARTLAANPKVLLLDEPLSALDALTRATLQDEIADIWQKNKTTVLWITNDPDEALLVADRVIPLLPGSNGATLGTDILVPLERPRDRKQIIRTAEFKDLKISIINALLNAKKDHAPTLTKKLSVPDLLPEDISFRPKFSFFDRPAPRRRSRLNKEEFQVEAPQ